jgi:hypothetical protein
VTGLVDRRGNPIHSSDYQNKKASPPALGERYGQWAGEQVSFLNLPGGGAVGFDTTQLTLRDFRQMKGHYQINSSLSVLTFMMHQMEWHIECTDKRIADHVQWNLGDIWSRLVRAMSQSLWAGYSPNVLQWENDITGRQVVLTKIKDLYPEDCRVHWDKVEKTIRKNGATQKIQHSVYGGIDQLGAPELIPVDNSYWYPILMENGNYYGRRLLESAFQPWFFSTLIHLFANRYYERYGEPTPIGRAPYEDEMDVNGTPVKGNVLMGMLIQQLRNRSTVVLPNERTPMGDETDPKYDYQLEYLESQMRGADFERYMTRLDEEMSLAMFTPILMMRTADVGSYNLGTQHSQVYQWMLNAIAGDWADYINKYIIRPMVRFNFTERAPEAKIRFMKMGKIQTDILQSVVSALVSKGAIKPDIRELGEFTGMTFEEVEVVTEDPGTPDKPDEDEPDPNEEDQAKGVARLIVNRVRGQISKAFREKTFGTSDFAVKMGYKIQMEKAFRSAGLSSPEQRTDDLFAAMDDWVAVSSSLGQDEYGSPDEYGKYFEARLLGCVDSFKR